MSPLICRSDYSALNPYAVNMPPHQSATYAQLSLPCTTYTARYLPPYIRYLYLRIIVTWCTRVRVTNHPTGGKQDVFQAVALNTVSASLRGYSGAIFAFGQTSSGKTWTVTGGEGFEERGLAPRSIGQLFREIADAEASTASINYQVSPFGAIVARG